MLPLGLPKVDLNHIFAPFEFSVKGCRGRAPVVTGPASVCPPVVVMDAAPAFSVLAPVTEILAALTLPLKVPVWPTDKGPTPETLAKVPFTVIVMEVVLVSAPPKLALPLSTNAPTPVTAAKVPLPLMINPLPPPVSVLPTVTPAAVVSVVGAPSVTVFV